MRSLSVLSKFGPQGTASSPFIESPAGKSQPSGSAGSVVATGAGYSISPNSTSTTSAISETSTWVPVAVIVLVARSQAREVARKKTWSPSTLHGAWAVISNREPLLANAAGQVLLACEYAPKIPYCRTNWLAVQATDVR
jgi:hypothetical protein